ncbi:MAG: aminotransferase class I/II-fold pyridoxal phosphate-dependent enzyme [Kofleriaceae bacterium]|nr:aminotransferase class I/II-fold pyridoxal phosphate-dependent enzyme [Kofleriaceae bacterium]
MQVDLRSDTVTRPTAAMRQAMANAEVGDDVYGEDPTVLQLQREVATLLGTQDALWTPTGVMANQIALRAHTTPGDEVLIGKDAHCWRFESGALAALAGVQTTELPGDGRFTSAAVRAAFKPQDPFVAPSKVLAVENTHTMAGGVVWDMANLRDVVATAKQLGMARHLDGARLWNAAVALGLPEGELAAGFDTISVCFSKGLGAPAGSVLAGSHELIKRCVRFRKMYGGGMRQVGILAAGALHALHHHRARLHQDHELAKLLAAGVAKSSRVTIDQTAVMTNAVMIDLHDIDATTVLTGAKKYGVLLGKIHDRRIRALTHLDVGPAHIEYAVTCLLDVLAQAPQLPPQVVAG